MKIETNEIGKKEYYDEFLYILFNLNKIKGKPKKKVYGLTKCLMIYIVLILCSMALFIFLYLDSKKVFYIFFIGMSALLLIYAVFLDVITYKRIKMFMSISGNKTVLANENGIEFIDKDKNIRMNWDDIAYILINKESICMIPKTMFSNIISLSLRHREDIINCLKKYEKDNLLIDNSSLY